ncbi:MAG: hypothetical protein CME68_05810 [Halobacteriovoraceae bacterium]|nr:hypothetical protein [Halobacteriovoraceae bacterium]
MYPYNLFKKWVTPYKVLVCISALLLNSHISEASGSKKPKKVSKGKVYSFKFFHDQLLLTNDELKMKKRDRILAEENLTVSKSGHYPKLDLKVGANGGSEQEASSSSVDPSGGAGKMGLSGGSAGTSNYKVNSDSISGSLGLTYNVFSRFATHNSILNAQNGVNQKLLERDLLLDRKKKELIHLLLEMQSLLKIKKVLLRAEYLLKRLAYKSRSKTRRLFFGSSRGLKIDKKYKEILYQKTKVTEYIETGHLALKNLIPNYRPYWLKGLKKLSISYNLPSFDDASKKFLKKSKTSKNLSLDIQNYKNIHNTTTWERAWIPLAFLSASQTTTQSLKTKEVSNGWSASLVFQFNLFDGFYSSARRSQAFNMYKISQIKKRDQLSKGVILLRKDYAQVKTSSRKKNFIQAIIREKRFKIKNIKQIRERGVSTKTEESFMLLDLAKKEMDKREAQKNYEIALLNIATNIDELNKVKIYESTTL